MITKLSTAAEGIFSYGRRHERRLTEDVRKPKLPRAEEIHMARGYSIHKGRLGDISHGVWKDFRGRIFVAFKSVLSGG